MNSPRLESTSSNQLPRPWLKHYDPGVPPSIQYPDHTVHDFLREFALRHPDHPCAILGDQSATYAVAEATAESVACALAAMGVGKGDRVGILMPNIPPFLMAFYGILKAGAVVVAINPLYTSDELTHQINDSGVAVAFVAAGQYEMLKSVQGSTGVRQVVVAQLQDGLSSNRPGQTGGRALRQPKPLTPGTLRPGDVWLKDLLQEAAVEGRPLPEVTPDDAALFQYSGGTTGISKAAVASHRGVVANTMQFRHWLVTLREAEEVMLLAIPLYHAYGMIAGMSLGVALAAGLVLVPNPRDTAALVEAIQRRRPTVFPGVPALVQRSLERPRCGERRGRSEFDPRLHLGLHRVDAPDQGALRSHHRRQDLRGVRPV